jgi:hypothetical protein
MNFGKRLNDLQSEIINALCAVEEFPAGLLPHTVYVEEEGENSQAIGNSVYNIYSLIRMFPDGSCMLENPETGTEEKRDLREINIEWLITVWDYCCDLSGMKEPQHKEKKLYIFVYPVDGFERNTDDTEILAAWERGEAEKYTPDEFAELANDEMFDEISNWIRFIEVEE